MKEALTTGASFKIWLLYELHNGSRHKFVAVRVKKIIKFSTFTTITQLLFFLYLLHWSNKASVIAGSCYQRAKDMTVKLTHPGRQQQQQQLPSGYFLGGVGLICVTVYRDESLTCGGWNCGPLVSGQPASGLNLCSSRNRYT